MLPRAGNGEIGLACVAEDAIRRQAEVARQSQDARAPIAEPIPVAFKRHPRRRDKVVGTLQIAAARLVDVQHRNHRRRLREAVSQPAPNANAHGCRPREKTHQRLFHRTLLSCGPELAI